MTTIKAHQPPTGGCVLKNLHRPYRRSARGQPPTGGCVLKKAHSVMLRRVWEPAAYGRLCVEKVNLS